MDFQKTIRMLRGSKSQQYVSDGTGIAVPSLSKMENSKLPVSIDSLKRLGKLFNVPVSFIILAQEEGIECKDLVKVYQMSRIDLQRLSRKLKYIARSVS